MPIAIPFLLFALLLLIVFLGQNLEPVVPIVLFGLVFPPLPLALWLLGGFVLGLGLSMSFVLIMAIARRTRKAKPGIADSEAWDDPDWNEGATTGSRDGDRSPPKTMPKPPDIDAPFRVITPPMRKLEEDD
jgi:uncharacterized integral membrane protein